MKARSGAPGRARVSDPFRSARDRSRPPPAGPRHLRTEPRSHLVATNGQEAGFSLAGRGHDVTNSATQRSKTATNVAVSSHPCDHDPDGAPLHPTSRLRLPRGRCYRPPPDDGARPATRHAPRANHRSRAERRAAAQRAECAATTALNVLGQKWVMRIVRVAGRADTALLRAPGRPRRRQLGNPLAAPQAARGRGPGRPHHRLRGAALGRVLAHRPRAPTCAAPSPASTAGPIAGRQPNEPRRRRGAAGRARRRPQPDPLGDRRGARPRGRRAARGGPAPRPLRALRLGRHLLGRRHRDRAGARAVDRAGGDRAHPHPDRGGDLRCRGGIGPDRDRG